MAGVIKDGTGTKKSAKVDTTNRLNTRAITQGSFEEVRGVSRLNHS